MTTTAATLADFLLARLAEDERAAHYALTRDSVDDRSPGGWGGWWIGHYHHYHRHDPARVLGEVEAKRAIVEMHQNWREAGDWNHGERYCRTCSDDDRLHWNDRDNPEWPCPTLRALASVYRDHDEWREEWG